MTEKAEKAENLEKGKKNNLKVLGTVKTSMDIIWIGGSYYGKDVIEEEDISNEIPIFGTVEQTYEKEKVRELLLIYSEAQNTELSVNNIQLEDETTSYDAFLKGAEDIFNDADFFALRMGTFYLKKDRTIERFDPQTPKYRVQLTQAIREAADAEVEMFLKVTDYTFIQFFRKNVEQFLIILPNLYKRLLSYQSFNKDVFLQRVSDLCYQLPPEVLSKLIENLESMAKPEKEPVGYVMNVSRDQIEIITKAIFDVTLSPILAIDCDGGKTAVIVIKGVEGKKIFGKVLYVIQEDKLTATSISILKGYTVRRVMLRDIEIALRSDSTTSKIKPIKIPVGRLIGIYDENGKLCENSGADISCEGLDERARGQSCEIPGEYSITLIPGELSNGILIGSSGSGKSNGLKVFIIGVLSHNKYDLTNKCGLLVFDRAAEYSGMLTDLKDKPEYQDLIQIIKVYDDPKGKFKIHEIPLTYYANKDTEENYHQDLKIILRFLRQQNLIPAESNNPDPFNPRFSVEALNCLLDPDQLNTIRSRLENEVNLHSSRIDALCRRIANNIDTLQPILQIRKNNRGLYEEIPSEISLSTILYNAQKKGIILILDVLRIQQGKTYTIFSDLVLHKLQKARSDWFFKSLEESGGDQTKFNQTAPLFLQINEEATSMFAFMKSGELGAHIEAATGARKYNLGTVYVFQTLLGIMGSVKMILTQLGGFNVVFSVTLNDDRDVTLNSVSIQEAHYMDEFIKNAKPSKFCVTSCEATENRPFFVKFYKAEDYLEKLFKVQNKQLNEAEKKYEQQKELKKDEPQELRSEAKIPAENKFKKSNKNQNIKVDKP